MKNKREHSEVVQRKPSRLRKSLRNVKRFVVCFCPLLDKTHTYVGLGWMHELLRDISHGELKIESTIESIAMLDFWLGPNVMKLIGRNPGLNKKYLCTVCLFE